MELVVYRLICWKCAAENGILALRGTGAYHCSRCDAVIMDAETIIVPEIPKDMKKPKPEFMHPASPLAV